MKSLSHAYLVVAVWMAASCLAFGQRSIRSIERLYYRGDYQTLAKDNPNPDNLSPKALLCYASSYYHLGEADRAFALYERAFSQMKLSEADHPFLTEYGRLNLERENASLAMECFNLALSQVKYPDSLSLLSLYLAYAKQLKEARDAQSEGFRWVAYNLKDINTPEPEYSLFIHKGRLYFITRRDPRRGYDPADQLPHEALYWTEPGSKEAKPIGFFSKKHEGIAGFLRDTLIVYRSSRRRGDFYIAYPRGDGWSQPLYWKNFPNSRRGCEDAICEDPKTGDIIFSSDRKGTKGGEDLWITRRLPDGKFSKPENLSSLNTPYNEDAPFVFGDTLFFVHDGPSSMGGYDIFYSIRQPGGGWGPPKRLPRPFNSPAHDSYVFLTHPDSIYLSSNRMGGQGKMDLYLIVREILPPPPPPPPTPEVYTFSGKAYDVRTRQPVPVVVVLKPQSGTEPLTLKSDKDGSFSDKKPDAGEYLLYAYADGYAQYVQPITIPKAGNAVQDIPMISNEELKRIRLPRIHFNFDRYDLRTEAPPALDSVVRILEAYPTLIIEVAGHTDSIGTREYNQRLSERRANTAQGYLRERGIAPQRLRVKGYGEDQPMVPNDTPYHRFLNRRVEFNPVIGRPEEME
ncbi:MAG: OmpA family protein [Bacteroidia bacterium]|nr:OmpA family protein [Bacteroidia bacterium]